MGHCVARKWFTLTTAVALYSASASAAPVPLIQGVVPLQIVNGVNMVDDFDGHGRRAMIILGRRDNGNAHGYHLITVMLPSKLGDRDWNVVAIETRQGFEDTLRDDPHTGEGVVRAVRLVRAQLEGRRSVLLVVATRAIGQSIPEPSRVTLETFTLKSGSNEGAGVIQEYFSLVSSKRTDALYCNAEMALKTEFGIPLPGIYEGGRSKTGC